MLSKLLLLAGLVAAAHAGKTNDLMQDRAIPEEQMAQVPSSAGYLAPTENEFVEEASGSPRQVTTELIDTTRTPSFIQVDAASKLGRRAGLWGQAEPGCEGNRKKCSSNQDCCGGFECADMPWLGPRVRMCRALLLVS